MTVILSNDYVFEYNRNQIIKMAGRKVGAFQAGETPDAQTMQDFSDALNLMVKRWNAQGIHVWTETEATLFLQPGQYSYSVGPGTTDNCTEIYSTTTLAADYTSGTTITVASATGIASGYYIGVVLNNGNIGWTTVNGSPSGNTVTLTAGLADTATTATNVYFYQTPLVKPLRVPFGRRHYLPSAIDTPMTPLARHDYYDLPNKANTGTITQYYFDPKLTTAMINLWPAPSDAQSTFSFTWYKPIQNFDSGADDADLPQEWIDCLVFNLARVTAVEYGVPSDTYSQIKELAMETLEEMKGFDREPESLYCGVDFTFMGYGR